MSRQVITEVKNKLLGGQKTFECEYLKRDADELVIIYTMKQDIMLEDIALKKGTISLGYFWPDKNYNAYHWIDESNNTLALYFNVADQTKITSTTVEWRDLIVDILIDPHGRVKVLDEHELPDNLDANLHLLINTVRDSLLNDVKNLLAYFSGRSKEMMLGHE